MITVLIAAGPFALLGIGAGLLGLTQSGTLGHLTDLPRTTDGGDGRG